MQGRRRRRAEGPVLLSGPHLGVNPAPLEELARRRGEDRREGVEGREDHVAGVFERGSRHFGADGGVLVVQSEAGEPQEPRLHPEIPLCQAVVLLGHGQHSLHRLGIDLVGHVPRRHGVRESPQAVNRQLILHQRVVHEGQDQRLLFQDLEERLVRPPPQGPVGLVGQSQDLAERQALLLPVSLKRETEAARQLREESAERARAGVVALVEEALFRFGEGVRAHAPRLPEEMTVPCQRGVVDQGRGHVIRDVEPFQLEKEHEVADLRQMLFDSLSEIPMLRPCGV